MSQLPESTNYLGDAAFSRIVHFRAFAGPIVHTVVAGGNFTSAQLQAMAAPLLKRTHYLSVSFGHSLLFSGHNTGSPQLDKVTDGVFVEEIHFSLPSLDGGDYSQVSYVDGHLSLLHTTVTIIGTKSRQLAELKDVWVKMTLKGRFIFP